MNISIFFILETKRVESGDKYKNVPMVELHHDKPHSNAVKIRIPVKEFPKVKAIKFKSFN
jgi:hypothetical protein